MCKVKLWDQVCVQNPGHHHMWAHLTQSDTQRPGLHSAGVHLCGGGVSRMSLPILVTCRYLHLNPTEDWCCVRLPYAADIILTGNVCNRHGWVSLTLEGELMPRYPYTKTYYHHHQYYVIAKYTSIHVRGGIYVYGI
jgi:hypothetical protein